MLPSSSPHQTLPQTHFRFFTSLQKSRLLRDNKTKQHITSKLDKSLQQNENGHKRNHENQRPTPSHIEESHENTKLKVCVCVCVCVCVRARAHSGPAAD